MRLLIALLATTVLLSAADLKLGKPVTQKQPVAIATLLAHPENYVGKTVMVKGKITAVCEEMGCWMDIADDAGKKVHIKVNDGEIEFPKDSPGKTATAEGVFTKIDAAKDAEGASHTTSAYQIQGSGAVIYSN